MLYNFTFPSIESAETTVYSGVFSQKFLIKHFFEGIFAIYIYIFLKIITFCYSALIVSTIDIS